MPHEFRVGQGNLAGKRPDLPLVRASRIGWRQLKPIEFGLGFLSCDILEAHQLGVFLALLASGRQSGLNSPVSREVRHLLRIDTTTLASAGCGKVGVGRD